MHSIIRSHDRSNPIAQVCLVYLRITMMMFMMRILMMKMMTIVMNGMYSLVMHGMILRNDESHMTTETAFCVSSIMTQKEEHIGQTGKLE